MIEPNYELSDEEIDTHKLLVYGMAQELVNLFGLRQWKINLHFSRRGFQEEDDKLVAFRITVQTAYHSADIETNLPISTQVSPIGLRRRLAHEFAHILLDPVDLTENSRDQNIERATENLARLLLWLETFIPDSTRQLSGFPVAPYDANEAGPGGIALT